MQSAEHFESADEASDDEEEDGGWLAQSTFDLRPPPLSARQHETDRRPLSTSGFDVRVRCQRDSVPCSLTFSDFQDSFAPSNRQSSNGGPFEDPFDDVRPQLIDTPPPPCRQPLTDPTRLCRTPSGRSPTPPRRAGATRSRSRLRPGRSPSTSRTRRLRHSATLATSRPRRPALGTAAVRAAGPWRARAPLTSSAAAGRRPSRRRNGLSERARLVL